MWSTSTVVSQWKDLLFCLPSWRCPDECEDVQTHSASIKLQRSSLCKIAHIIQYWRSSECADTQIRLWEDWCCSRNSEQDRPALLNPTHILSLRVLKTFLQLPQSFLHESLKHKRCYLTRATNIQAPVETDAAVCWRYGKNGPLLSKASYIFWRVWSFQVKSFSIHILSRK